MVGAFDVVDAGSTAARNRSTKTGYYGVANSSSSAFAAGALNTRNADANSVAAEATNVFEIGVICLFLLQGPTKEASACDAH